MSLSLQIPANENGAPAESASLFRIDCFECPPDHVRAFSDRLAIIHGYFDTLEGCLYNRVAVAPGPSTVKIVTIVEWKSAAALTAAKEAVDQFYSVDGFDPKIFMAERGITGEFGLYHDVAAFHAQRHAAG